MIVDNFIATAASLLSLSSWQRYGQTVLSELHGHSSVISSHGLNLTDDLFEFHKNLVEIESISLNERAVGEWLAHSLKSQGYNVEKQEVSQDPLRFNVLAWPGKTRDAPVLLTSHIDVVPPYWPYRRLKNGTISGRGTVDAKGSVASQVLAVNQLLSNGSITTDDIALLYVVGEEIHGDGMRTANSLGLKPKTVIFGEPTEGKLVAGHKGIISFNITTIGKAAHSGYPWLGRSAIDEIIRASSAVLALGRTLPSSDKYGNTTINIGKIQGGLAANVVAEGASALVAMRIAEGSPAFIEKEVTKAVHSALEDYLVGDLKAEDLINITFLGGYGPVDIDADVPGFDVITVNYGTDVPNFNETVKGQKRYLYGPGSIQVAHSDHEALTESELLQAVEDYQRIIMHALKR
ncbi:hypothetical protein AMS68_005765 [Peltaster fructicola]|uniref:Peptidase M20 dimerisation domain-containing protein n=1 Tax=Peltaster fructicola TaxID=286661 RepID=A0A6H0Y080_9PEZI|nr:hypothetical protein AMS68_005765 [Peltaster fructicola]